MDHRFKKNIERVVYAFFGANVLAAESVKISAISDFVSSSWAMSALLKGGPLTGGPAAYGCVTLL